MGSSSKVRRINRSRVPLSSSTDFSAIAIDLRYRISISIDAADGGRLGFEWGRFSGLEVHHGVRHVARDELDREVGATGSPARMPGILADRRALSDNFTTTTADGGDKPSMSVTNGRC